jgi:hypothetical protein
MTQPVLARTMKAVDWLGSAYVTTIMLLLAVAFIGSGIISDKPGLLVCGAGWTLGMVLPHFLRQPSIRRLVPWARIVGVLVFILGLAIHGCAL